MSQHYNSKSHWDRNTLINPFMVCVAVGTFGLSGPAVWICSVLVSWRAGEQSLRFILCGNENEKGKLCLNTEDIYDPQLFDLLMYSI